jgi:hypothetical protein
MGGHLWRGEDPEMLRDSLSPTVVADTPERAETILRAVADA